MKVQALVYLDPMVGGYVARTVGTVPVPTSRTIWPERITFLQDQVLTARGQTREEAEQRLCETIRQLVLEPLQGLVTELVV